MTVSELQNFQANIPFANHLDDIVTMMRAISKQTDPADVFREYASRIRQFYPVDRVLIITQDSKQKSQIKIAMVADWDEPIYPWMESDHFQPISSGLLYDLCLQGEPVILSDVTFDAHDESESFLEGMHSLRAVPLFDHGSARHMIIGLKEDPHGFQAEELPTLVWLSNMFGRTIQNLVTTQKLEQAYQAIDQELKTVGEIQQSLLPESLPDIPGMELAAYYAASHRAGGDYYDFFPLPDGKWGIFIADVSGHGTPAAVLMSIMHTIAHTYTGTHDPPSQFLNHLNRQLSARYTSKTGAFVTAFYAIYDPETLKLTYSSAGHNPPLRRRCGSRQIDFLDRAGRMPLGISDAMTYRDAELQIKHGDRIVLYTDGIVEAQNNQDELFGTDRLGQIVGRCDLTTSTIVDELVQELKNFTGTTHQSDDRTLVVLKVR